MVGAIINTARIKIWWMKCGLLLSATVSVFAKARHHTASANGFNGGDHFGFRPARLAVSAITSVFDHEFNDGFDHWIAPTPIPIVMIVM